MRTNAYKYLTNNAITKRQDELQRRIDAATLNEEIPLEDFWPGYECVSFDNIIDGEFCWYLRRRGAMDIQPLASSQTVKTWKTLAGAKRNFLRRFLPKVKEEL